MPEKTSTRAGRYLQAFQESFNVVGMALAAAGTLALAATPLMPLPLLVGLVAEAFYLMFVPDSRWYEQRLSKRHDAEVRRRREELMRRALPQIHPDMQQKFQRLVQLRSGIESQVSPGDEWFREVLRKLDFLLEKFLHFAVKEVQFRRYLISVLEEARQERGVPTAASEHNRQRSPSKRQVSGPGRGTTYEDQPHEPPRTAALQSWAQVVEEVGSHYAQEVASIERQAAQEQDESTRAVLEKRVTVLQRRREFLEKIAKMQSNLRQQLLLVEDTFGLISDEIRAHPPDQVLADIDDVVLQTNAMTQALEEMAPLEKMLAR